MSQMNEKGQMVIIAKLEAKIRAQEKTIETLMNTVERRTSEGPTSIELLSQNLNLEKVVQHKTGVLQRQGEELRKALHDLQLTQARLLQAQKLESVGQLAAGIAHEINTPAQFIGSNIDFLNESFSSVKRLVDALLKVLQAIRQGDTLDEASREVENLLVEVDWEYLDTEIPKAIQQSKEGIKRVTTIVQAMKEFSHPGSKEKAYYDLNKIIETTITVASNEWKYCADIETRFDRDLPEVYCLADEIGQVFLNILVNASHAIASKNKGTAEKGRIVISTRQFLQHVEVSIEDTGIGIPENIQERVFDPFFTTKPVGMGTGQGLAIAHDVIQKKHGGSIDFVSEQGKGSVFTLRLPIGKV